MEDIETILNSDDIYKIVGVIVIIGVLVCLYCFDNNDDPVKYLKNIKIPNIIHFVFGLKEQDEEFFFTYYLAVYSAWVMNKPDKIYFYYHYKPYGKWFNELKNIPNIIFEYVDIPTHIGRKPLKKVAHKADIIRMNKLIERGGVYMDIDTISAKSYHHLLNNEVVLGKEGNYGICNAIMMTIPNSRFFKLWMDQYEEEFISDGWAEASVIFPKKLYEKYPDLISLQEQDVFFYPGPTETDKIFKYKYDISPNLVTLQLWETFTINYLRNIDIKWLQENKHTLYSKIVSKFISL